MTTKMRASTSNSQNIHFPLKLNSLCLLLTFAQYIPYATSTPANGFSADGGFASDALRGACHTVTSEIEDTLGFERNPNTARTKVMCVDLNDVDNERYLLNDDGEHMHVTGLFVNYQPCHGPVMKYFRATPVDGRFASIYTQCKVYTLVDMCRKQNGNSVQWFVQPERDNTVDDQLIPFMIKSSYTSEGNPTNVKWMPATVSFQRTLFFLQATHTFRRPFTEADVREAAGCNDKMRLRRR